MANRYLYMGVKAGFTRNSGTVTDNTSVAASWNATYTDGVITFGTSSSATCDFTTGSGAADFATTGETLWTRFDSYGFGGGFTIVLAQWQNSSDQPVLRLNQTSSTVVQLQYNSGTLASPVWTQIGANITRADSTRYSWAVKLVIDAAGTAHGYEVFKDNVSQISGTFSASILTRVDNVALGVSANTTTYISQVLCSIGISLVNSFIAALKASGAGSNAGMTGAFTDVNEAVLNDATVVSSNTAAQRTTFAIADLPAITGFTIGTEQRHVSRANNDGSTGPQNLKSVNRNSGVDTVGGNMTGIGLGFKPLMQSYNLTYTQINTAGFELGWESSA